MRIGILGGTFDPPHIGHLRFAEAALEQLKLDEVLFLPANRNPQKSDPAKAGGKQRLEMVRRMIEENDKFSYTDIEITRGGPSYSVDTLAELQMVRPADYWFLVGADAVRDLPKWKQPHRLLKMCRLGVALRPPTIEAEVMARIPEEFKQFVDLVHMQPVDVSATDLRDKLAKGKSIVPWVHPRVLQFIQESKLYRS
jgi:nicotinate-nucleotide adenylyltransferase